MMPGKPGQDLALLVAQQPREQVDSPSRSRSFVLTLRELNDGTSCPATLMLGPSALLSTISRRG